MRNFIPSWMKPALSLLLSLAALCVMPAAHAQLGNEVVNVASMTYDDDDGRVTVVTNPATFTIEAERTPSTIEFFRVSPNAPNAFFDNVNGSDFSPTGELSGPFTSTGEPVSGGRTIDLSGSVPLTPATTYVTGELMIVRVIDTGQNGNPDVIETVTITVTTSTGDSVVLRLYESGPNTGEFYAYIPSTRDPTANFDNTLTTGSETTLVATYVDPFDSTEVSVDTALVDPYCRVFNALTGDLIDGASVTIIDTATGQPANVLGTDGISEYPSTVISGQPVTDSSGFTYELREGEFRFPLIPAGTYRVDVVTPEGFKFSSVVTSFGDLTNAPFAVEDGSFGESFSYDSPSQIHFDIPLDPETDIVLAKRADPQFGDVGDPIRYTVTVENRGVSAAPMKVLDLAPRGFRYERGSSRLGTMAIADPLVGTAGRQLTYMLPVVQPGQTVELSYVMRIGADVREGEFVNSAVALDGFDVPYSNVSRATVTVREELFRSRSTIIGRVAERACDPDEDWAKEIVDGRGVEGVRLYLETGHYVVSDQDGLFHFEGVKEGTHVVQVDEETLPQGYTPMVCEENTQYADADTSKFVDVKGGGIWRANFYLTRNDEELEVVEAAQEYEFLEYKKFDADWLETQNSDTNWVYPQEGQTPSLPTVNMGIKHDPSYSIALELNGEAVPMTNLVARETNTKRTAMITRWRGIDVLNGKNVFVANVKDADGTVIDTMRREVHYVTTVARIIPVPEESNLTADGRTTPIIAVRVTDEAGRPVRGGRALEVDITPPYQFEIDDRLESSTELVAPVAGRQGATVDPDGIARIRLEPTLLTGSVSVTITMDDERKVDVSMYLKPEKRDWIVVGLAEMSAGLRDLSGEGVDMGDDDDVFKDGRLAFFAKGMIKGDWLLTLAVDTDKRRGSHSDDLFGQIDPNQYYSLYGDRTYQHQEGASRYPVYVKLEKETFYAMFGDYNTNLVETDLARYSRRLTGLKAEYSGEVFEAIAFAAETHQGFAKDEIAANGTSGPYRTRFAPIVANSEVITIETRDRFRADEILDTRVMQRHLDYTIDNLTGEIIFRLPVDVTDPLFNPNVIVVDYETFADAEKNISFGGRVAATPGSNNVTKGKLTVGATYIHEEGRADAPNGETDLVGVDARYRLNEGTEIRAEYAMSRDSNSADDKTAKSWLAEIVHTSERFAGEAYIREEEDGFGVGQQTTATASRRRYGAGGTVKVSEKIEEETGRRQLRVVEGKAYREENLETGATRTLGEITARQDSERLGLSAGLRAVEDDVAGETRRSMMAIASGRYTIPKHGLTLTAAHEQPLGDEDASTSFPQRTTIGADKTLTEKASLSLRHEFLEGENASGQNTTVGVTYSPWAGTDVSASTDRLTSDGANRLGATVGVDQQWIINDKWSASTGVSRRQVLDENGNPQIVAPDAAISPVEANTNYMSGYLGVGYRTEKLAASTRIEARKADEYDTIIGTFGAARELTDEFSLAATGRMQMRETHEGPGNITETRELRTDLRVGAAWRPRGEGTVVFERFDYKYNELADGTTQTKLVNNMAANTMINDRWQLTGNWGVKYTETDLGGDRYDSLAMLLGAETRFDITQRIDVGIAGSVLMTDGTESMAYSIGPSVGFSPLDNTWISLGYNFSGYSDEDFEGAEYSDEGVYVKFRLKFDQDSLSSLLKRISPQSP